MPHGAPRLRAADQLQNLCGPRVKALRAAKKVTQDALCAHLATATGGRWNPTIFDIYRIESGRRIVSDLEILALSIALECDVYDLLGVVRGSFPFPGKAPKATISARANRFAGGRRLFSSKDSSNTRLFAQIGHSTRLQKIFW